jgi:hypothetical protein
MPNITESDRLAGMVAAEQGEETRQLAVALIYRAMEVVETLPVDGGTALTNPLSKLHVALSAVKSIPLVNQEVTR